MKLTDAMPSGLGVDRCAVREEPASDSVVGILELPGRRRADIDFFFVVVPFDDDDDLFLRLSVEIATVVVESFSCCRGEC